MAPQTNPIRGVADVSNHKSPPSIMMPITTPYADIVARRPAVFVMLTFMAADGGEQEHDEPGHEDPRRSGTRRSATSGCDLWGRTEA